VRTIGLTGNVASGKTAVADRWREKGVLVIDADRLGHDVLREDEAARAALMDAFGGDIVDRDGAIDRSALGERAFASAEATRRLNAIVHPPLLERLEAALAQARADGRALAVVDAALIFEFGLDARLDLNVLVTAPARIRAERLRRKGLGEEMVARIMASQMPDADKAARCDFVLVNDGSLDALRARADEVLEEIAGMDPATGRHS
jgi:dephospho-CoA kinase